MEGANFFTPEFLAQQEEARKKREQQISTGELNPDGSPGKPLWQSNIDPATGQLRSQYQLNVDTFDPNSQESYAKYKQEALRTGPSTWANLMLQKQQQEEQDTRSAAARQSQAAMNQGFGALAMRGGLGVGSRNRLAATGMKDLLAQRQMATRQGVTNRLGIGTSDEESRQKQLQNLATADLQTGQYNTTLKAKQAEANNKALLAEVEGKRLWDANQYQEQMKKWAAGKQAEATANSGGGGGGGK